MSIGSAIIQERSASRTLYCSQELVLDIYTYLWIVSMGMCGWAHVRPYPVINPIAVAMTLYAYGVPRCMQVYCSLLPSCFPS